MLGYERVDGRRRAELHPSVVRRAVDARPGSLAIESNGNKARSVGGSHVSMGPETSGGTRSDRKPPLPRLSVPSEVSTANIRWSVVVAGCCCVRRRWRKCRLVLCASDRTVASNDVNTARFNETKLVSVTSSVARRALSMHVKLADVVC